MVFGEWLDEEVHGGAREGIGGGETDTGRIRGTGGGTLPTIEDFEGERGALSFSGGVDPRERGGGISGAVGAAELVKHEFATVGEVHAEPVPADLAAAELAAADFVVHPRFAGDAEFFGGGIGGGEGGGVRVGKEGEFAVGAEAGKREVVARGGGIGTFAGNAVFAEDHERFRGRERERERGFSADTAGEEETRRG